MDFLSNLWSGIKSIGSSIGSALSPNMTIAPKSGLADVSSLLSGAQSALSSGISNTKSALVLPSKITTPYMTVAPKEPTVRNISTAVATPYAPTYNPYQTVAPQEQFAGSITTPYMTPAPQSPSFSSSSPSIQAPISIRGGKDQITKEIYGNEKSAINPYAVSGSSSANISSDSAGAGSPTTRMGITGTIPGTSVNQGSLIVNQQEEERKRQQLGTQGYQNTGRVLSEQQLNQMFNTSSGSPLQIGGGAYKFAGREYIPQRNADGSTSFIERSGQSGVGGSLSQTNIPVSGGAVDLSQLTSRVGEISGVLDLIKQGKVLNPQEALSAFQKELESSLQQIQTQNPIPPTPVVDTIEQQNFLNMLEPTQQNTIRQQMDEVRLRLNLPNLESQRLNALNQIQAINESFKKITDEIKNNPDLPKSLAQRQIQEFAKTSQGLLDSYNSQLQIISQQISDANQTLNNEFKIIETEDSIRRQAIEDNRAVLKSLIDTGAISEYDNAQIGELATATGYSVSSLKALQKAVKTKADKYANVQYITDDNGNVTVVGINEAGQPVKLGALGSIGKADKATTVSTEGMTTKQQGVFNQIVSQYNRSPLILASDRTSVLKNTIQNVKNDPSNGAQQLNLAYSYIQALDTYQSAVREGELSLVNSIDSSVGKIQNAVQQIQNGQIVRPEVAKQIAAAAETVVNTINNAAQAKAKSFASQAKVNGIEKQWNEYISGFNPGYSTTQPSSGFGVRVTNPKTGQVVTGSLTQDEIDDAISQGFKVEY